MSGAPSFPNDTYAATITGISKIPKGPHGRFTFGGGSGFAISKNSSHQDAAFDFLTIYLDPENPYLNATLAEGTVTAYESLRVDAILKGTPEVIATLEALPFAFPQTYPTIDLWQNGDIEGSNIVPNMIHSIATKNETIDQATARFCGQMNAIMFPPKPEPGLSFAATIF